MTSNDSISSGSVVSLVYTLRLDDADDVVDQTTNEEPFMYLHGSDSIIPGLEKELEGKKPGQTFSAVISPEDAYGEREEDALFDVDRKELPEEVEKILVVGLELSVPDDDGEEVEAWVAHIDDEVVTIDFNHPFAGKTLRFEIEILEIREATPEEIAHGHAHGPDDHHHD